MENRFPMVFNANNPLKINGDKFINLFGDFLACNQIQYIIPNVIHNEILSIVYISCFVFIWYNSKNNCYVKSAHHDDKIASIGSDAVCVELFF